MITILSIKSKTAKKLAEAGGFHLSIGGDIPADTTTLIRWGYTGTKMFGNMRVYNRAEAIRTVSNKSNARALFQELKIPVPRPTETEFPTIGRPQKHKKGQHFFICNNAEEVQKAKEQGAVYFSKLYPKKEEYRVHVAGGRAILVSIKIGDKTQIVWNKKSGFNFKHLHRHMWLENEKLLKLVKTAKRAVKKVGLDFGAVDIMAFAGSGLPLFVVCEINTCPALSPLAIQKYVAYFKSLDT